MARTALAHRADAQRRPALGFTRFRGRFPPYLVLLRVGFTLPPALRPERCALTAPFHPYHCVGQPFGLAPRFSGGMFSVALCRPRALKPASRTLSGTLPCGVRTFLSRRPLHAQTPPAATARSSCQRLVYREMRLPSRSSTRDGQVVNAPGICLDLRPKNWVYTHQRLRGHSFSGHLRLV